MAQADEDGDEALPSPWTDLYNRPTPYDDYVVSQQTASFVQGTLRRYPLVGWFLLALFPLLLVVPVVAAEVLH